MPGQQLDVAPLRIESGRNWVRIAGRISFQVLDPERALVGDAEFEARVVNAVLTRLSGCLPHLAELSKVERNHCLCAELRPSQGILLTRLERSITIDCVE